MSNFYQKLCDAIGAASVREQEPMSAHTTFRAGGPARYFVTPEGEKELLRGMFSYIMRQRSKE